MYHKLKFMIFDVIKQNYDKKILVVPQLEGFV